MFHPPEEPLGPRVPVKADRFTPSPPKPKGGLQRQKGSSQLEMAVKPAQETQKLKPSTSTGKLIHSASMVNLTTTTTRAPSAAPLSSAPSTTTNIYAKQYIPRSGRSVSTLRHASAEPRRAGGGPAPFRIEPSDQMQLVEGFPTSFSTKKVEKMENSGNTTPPPSLTSSESDSGASGAPGLIRSASGSMLLRRTAERTRRQSESPKKTTMRRSGSVGGALSGVGGACGVGGVFPKESEDVEMKETPVLKRKRTTSMTSLLQSISTNDDAPPILTPQRTRPLRGASVGGGASSPQKSPMKKMTSSSSPMKKRGRPEEGGGASVAPPSPRKRIHFASMMAMGMDRVNDVPSPLTIILPSQPLASTPIRNLRQSVFKPVSEHIDRTYGTPLRKSGTTTDVRPPTVPPKLVTRSTSGEIYYSANEDDVATPKRKASREEVYSTPLEFGKGEQMVPLVEKQISIDSSTTSSSTFMTSDGLIDDNGSYQESMKTIKKGQASSLSRCSSFKITPVTATTQNTGELEKSISTQSLHTTAPSTSTGSAPSLVRHNSTPIFRFKVSPSSYKPPAPAPVAPLEATVIPTVIPMETTVTPESTVDVTPIDQMPSTSSASEDVVKKEESDDVVKKPKKSSLREPLVEFPQRDDYGSPRARKIRFSGLDVHYFDRLQGSLTVPKEGCVTLAMHPRHHTHRHFSLASGRRPPLNLELYEDGELSEDEVIHPDDVEEIEEIQTTKHMDPIEPKQRIQILKKSGVKLEKNGGAEAMKTLRTTRSICGCDCPNGACDPLTCQCSLDGINCQVDGSAQHPCTCQAHLCRNPEGRSFYDEEAVRGYRRNAIAMYYVSQKTGIQGSPRITKFVDSDEEKGVEPPTMSRNKIKKLEKSPQKYPVTPVYARRPRSNLSDIRESLSEQTTPTSSTSSILTTPSTSSSTSTLSDRMRAMHQLDNDACVEEERDEDVRDADDVMRGMDGEQEEEYDGDKEETLLEEDEDGDMPNLTLHEEYVATEESEVVVDAEMIETTAMSPAKPTLVV